MKIVIDNQRVIETHSGVERETNSQGASSALPAKAAGGYTLDIFGAVMDNNAYEGQGKTAKDVMQEAGFQDTALMKNYLAVMSNSMSDEDFAKLQKEGFQPGSTEIETVVTIVDQIKAALVRGGADIQGYTDNLDREVLAAITGNEALADEIISQFQSKDVPPTRENMEEAAKALDAAAKTEPLNDAGVRYMINNRMEPTIENVYKAKHSAANENNRQPRGYYKDEAAGYYAKKADDFQWENLQPQMEKVIKEAGMEVTEDTLSQAKWLIEKGIPLTQDALTRLSEIRKLALPAEQSYLAASVASALSMGRPAAAASYVDPRNYAQKALDFLKDLEGISTEAADLLTQEGGLINLRNLKMAQIRLGMNLSSPTGENHTAGRLQLEEIRLKMTAEAGVRLQRKGFDLDTAELKALVEGLSAVEEKDWKALFAGEKSDQKAGLYRDTLAKVREIPFFPAALIGKFTTGSIPEQQVIIEDIHQEGKALMQAYQQAGESYETLMTAPRADLGDSVKKAFRSVDPLLEDMGMETSEENKRAVRILGYNNMEVTPEQVYLVKEMDLSVRRTIEKMTPGKVHKMIKEGLNPLQMNLQELNEYLNSQDQTAEHTAEKYSEYLYRLTNNHSITEEEKDAFIGIFRLFRQLEKTDGAAIGALVNAGAEVSLKNLLTSVRSSKKQGMDITVDDGFGGLDSILKTQSITDQINNVYGRKEKETLSDRGSRAKESYLKGLSKEIYEKLDAGKLADGALFSEMDLEEMTRLLREQTNEKSGDASYLKDQAEQMRQSAKADKEVIKMLMDFDQPITSDYLLAAGQLTKMRGRLIKQFKDLAKETGKAKEFDEAVKHLQDSLTQEEEASAAYEQLADTCGDIAEEAVDNSLDVRELSAMCRQIRLAANLAKEGNYEIPVTIDGEITSVNLRIIHSGDERGKVTVTMETKSYGKTAACFRAAGQEGSARKLSGYIACDHAGQASRLEERKEELLNQLDSSLWQMTDMRVIHSESLDINAFSTLTSKGESSQRDVTEKEAGAAVESSQLYEIAKAFIGFMQS